ncbi:MAG: class I SAM-dependent methyltransferase [Thermodesulforhabdaceae bacterium]
MQKTKFDDFAINYDDLLQKQHSTFGDISYYSEYKIKLVHQISEKYFGKNLRLNILEYGCGTGRNLQYFNMMFPESNIFGFDISRNSLEIAKSRNDKAIFLWSEDELLKYYNNYFDLVFVAGVYHHIPPAMRNYVTSVIKHITQRHGIVMVFEHNPYNPITRHMVNTCEFDDDAILLSKGELINLFEILGFYFLKAGYTLFFPPRLKKVSFIEKFIHWIPLGGQYYVVFKKSEQ